MINYHAYAHAHEARARAHARRKEIMEVKVEIYKYPIHWDDLPKEEYIYNLKDEKQKNLYIKRITNVKKNELISIQTETKYTENY